MFRIVFLGAVLALATVVRAQIKVGDPFPSLPAAGLDGAIPDMQGKVLLVDFWASWCGPCRTSFPAYGRIHANLATRGLAIVAVSVDKDPAAYAAFVKRMAPPFLTARDTGQNLVRKVQVPEMPTSYLIGRDGRVRYIHKGFHGGRTESELRGEIARLLDEKTNPQP
jgi:thiol-disulfide isomerase/thioredoxin